MNCIVYTVMEGHGNTTDNQNNNQNHNQNFKQGFLFSRLCPPEVRVEHKSCSTICGTHEQAILYQKNLTGLAGGVREGQNNAFVHIFH